MAKIDHSLAVYPQLNTEYQVRTPTGRIVRTFDMSLYLDGVAGQFLKNCPQGYSLVRVCTSVDLVNDDIGP